MANKRIFYAIKQVTFKGDGAGPTAPWVRTHGIQSISMSTSFLFDEVFELGQLAIYENIELIPQVECEITKVLDGSPLVYHRCTVDATSPTLVNRSATKCYIGLSIFKDTDVAAGSSSTFGDSEIEMSGMFVSRLSYTFPLEDNCLEEVTLQGNNRIWAKDSRIHPDAITWAGATGINIPGFFGSNNDFPVGSGGVNRRENIVFAISPQASGLDVNGMVGDPDTTILPPDVFGISSSGTNSDFAAHISQISTSVDLDREELFELGKRGPYSRTVNFPVEVTCEIETTSHSGDMVSATEAGILGGGTTCENPGNLSDRTIRIATCEGTRVYLGTKNKLASINYTGGDAGGGNVTVSYTFTTFNDFTVMHIQQTAIWDDRDIYLVER